jgi:DNA polymerase-1
LISEQSGVVKALIPEELNPPLQLHKITDVAGLAKVSEFIQKVSVFTIDTETNVVNDFVVRRIRTIQLGDRNEQFVIDLKSFSDVCNRPDHIGGLAAAQGNYRCCSCLQPIVDTLRPVLEAKTHLKVGQNLQFDYEVLKYCLGIRMWNLYDTMWAEKVLHAGEWDFNAKGYWALDDLVERYCGLRIDKSSQKSFDMESELTEPQWVYCALDCRLPLAIKAAQRIYLEKANLFKAVQIENDCIPATGDIHLNGVLIDETLWNKLLHDVRKDHEANVNRLDKWFLSTVGNKELPPYNLDELETVWKSTADKELRAEARKKFMECRKHLNTCRKNMKTYEGQAAINYGSPTQLLNALREMGYDKTRLKDTNDRTLKKTAENPAWDLAKAKEKHFENCGVIDTIRLYRETGKILDSYANFLADYKNTATGRIHSNLVQLGAETGRTSSRNPNVQNIKRGSDWRDCFIAESDDYRIITLDYNGCELRILAEYSREKVFLDAFLKGWDVHSVGAEIIFGETWKSSAVTEPYRDEKGKWVPACAYYFKENNSVNKDTKELESTGQDHLKCSCPKHKKLRDQIKSINFGIAYGMEAGKLAEEIGTTREEAQKLLDKYRGSFPILVKYLEASGEYAKTRFESRTLSQRRRFFPKPTWEYAKKIAVTEWEKKCKADDKKYPPPGTNKIGSKLKMIMESIKREGKNTPIQGSNADIAKIAMGCGFGKDGQSFMWQQLEPKFGAKLINFIHDEFVVQVHKDRAQECFDFMADCMTRAGAELVKLIPMTTEGVIGDRWKK